MNEDAVKETFGELFTLMEALETQNIAILQCLRDQGIAADEKLAPYLEEAGKASNVKWRAARMRMEYLFSPTKQGAKQSERQSDGKEPQGNREADRKSGGAQSEQGADNQKPKVAKDREHETPEAPHANAESEEKLDSQKSAQDRRR